MSMKAQITIRSKKLGLLIRDARTAARRSMKECAQALGITNGTLKAYEEGRKAPSLPELEALGYYLELPIGHFWSNASISDAPERLDDIDLTSLTALRQRMIGALLRQQRLDTSISMKAVAKQVGIPISRLKAYELGQRPIPLPELEAILSVLGGHIETFFDHGSPVGQWMTQQKAIHEFLDMPEELQSFVCQAINRPYLDLARKLSSMSTDKLRSVAENLLDITL